MPFEPDRVSSSNADDYGGVVLRLSDRLRLSVNGRGNRFFLQILGDLGGAPFWGSSPMYRTKAALLASAKVQDFARRVGFVGLLPALKAVPETPMGLCPDFLAERSRQAAAFRAADYGNCCYSGVVAVCDDWRLVVDPDGETYRLMFFHGQYAQARPAVADMWISCMWGPELAPIVRAISAAVGRFGCNFDLWFSTPEKLLPALAGLPALASDCDWLQLVERPISVNAQYPVPRFMS